MHTFPKLPDFEKPPIVEVVCGIQFDELGSLLAPHLGLLWEKYKADYPDCQEVPPLARAIERFDEVVSPDIGIDLTGKPPLPRIWFVHSKQHGLIQVQRDRFLHNWKRVEQGEDYPRYEAVIGMFRDRLSTFEQFISENALGEIKPQQYEITYVNHIPQEEGWESFGELGKVFPDFDWRAEAERFLPKPEAINWRTSFTLPENSGRLHVAIRSAQRRDDERPLLLCDLTVRGMAADSSKEAMWKWFAQAHEWIVRSFDDLTSTDIQKNVWGKKYE